MKVEIQYLYIYIRSYKLELVAYSILAPIKGSCGGTGMDSTVPTNTVQVPITKGIVKDSGSEYTGFISDIGRYIYRTGEL